VREDEADLSEEEWTRLERLPIVAGMAISLADPAGPDRCRKESMAMMKIVLEAAQPAGPARLVGAAARPGGRWAGG
jgi:hypothetical protein